MEEYERHFRAATFPFGREKSREHIQARIAWEMEAERIMANSGELNKDLRARFHGETRRAYEKVLASMP